MQYKCKCKNSISIVSSVSVRPVNKIVFVKKIITNFLYPMLTVLVSTRTLENAVKESLKNYV